MTVLDCLLGELFFMPPLRRCVDPISLFLSYFDLQEQKLNHLVVNLDLFISTLPNPCAQGIQGIHDLAIRMGTMLCLQHCKYARRGRSERSDG